MTLDRTKITEYLDLLMWLDALFLRFSKAFTHVSRPFPPDYLFNEIITGLSSPITGALFLSSTT
jgi:hypothetical protein